MYVLFQPPVPKKSDDSEGHERPGSRLGFVAMAPETSPGDKTAPKIKVCVVCV